MAVGQADERQSRGAPQPKIIPPTASVSPIAVLGRRVLRVLRDSIFLVLLALVVSGGAALGIAWRFSHYSYELSGTLLYTPLPIPERQRSLYTGPTQQTLMALLTLPNVMAKLCQEFDLDIPPSRLQKFFKVEAQKNTELIDVTLRWDDGATGEAMVNRLMQDFIHEVSEIRNKRLSQAISDTESNLADCKRRQASVQAAFLEFQIKEKAVDAKGGLERLNLEILTLQGQLANSRRALLNYQQQFKALEKYLSDLKQQQEKEDSASGESDAAQETIGDNRRRQDRLRELIEDERKREELLPLLTEKRAQLRRIKQLYDKRAATITQVESLQTEIGAITAKLQDSPKILEWRKEMERIDQVVVPKKRKSAGSPIIIQTLTKRLELELQITAMEEETVQLQEELGAKQKRTSEVSILQQKTDTFSKDLEILDQERDGIEKQRAFLSQLQQAGAREFTVVKTAKASAMPDASNRKLLLISVFSGCMVLFCGMLIGLDLLVKNASGEELSLFVGLPMLAKVDHRLEKLPSGEKSIVYDEYDVRTLALRIRQNTGKPGAIILFTAGYDDGKIVPVVAEMSRYFAHRDERVLLLDTRITRGSDPAFEKILDAPVTMGLSDFLNFECFELSEFLVATQVPAVDYIPAGQPSSRADVLATHRMREIIDEVRSKYTIILTVGPTFTSAVDLEILAAYADGIVLCLDHRGARMGLCKRFVASLKELKAPLLGTMVTRL